MTQIGSVVRIRRYPVKSMIGEDVTNSSVTERGLVGDRAFGVVDAESGKLASAKRPRLWGSLLSFSATFDGMPAAGVPLPAACITFPDGSVLSTEDPDIDGRLTHALGRRVRLARSSDEILYMEEVWNGDLKDDAPPYGPVVGADGGDQMIDVPASLGVPGGFFDATAIHIVTTATLRRLSELAPDSRFDVERFRPNLVIDVPGADGFVENEWPERFVEIGGGVRLEIIMRVPRCVVTTLAQGDLPRDPDVLRTITRHNKVGAFVSEYPCVGVYASVERGGSIAVGDPVALD